MIEPDRRVYTPPIEAADYAPADDEEMGASRKAMMAALMAIVVLALGAAAWNVYGGGPAPLIAGPAGDFKTITPQAAPPAPTSHEFDDAIEGRAGAAASSSASARPAPAAAPGFQARGAFLAQLAALRTQDDADAAWRTFAARAPLLAQGAHTEIQRASLGAAGVFYRLRVGYFDTNDRAGDFCARVRAGGRDCMVVSQ
jgi:cell division septation protein DedD